MEFLCRETNCRTFQVEPAFNHGRAHSNDLALNDNRRFAVAFLEAYDTACASGRHLYYSGARPWVITDRFCQAVDKALIVAPDGRLSACYEVYGREHPLAGAFFFGSLAADGSLTTEPEVRKKLQDQIAERRLFVGIAFVTGTAPAIVRPKPCEAEPADTEPGHDADESRDLLECEDLSPRFEQHSLCRHAVDATDIAAVRDTHPQARVNTTMGVDEGGGLAMSVGHEQRMASAPA